MEKVARNISCMLLVFLLVFGAVSCRGNFYFQKHDVWETENLAVKIDFNVDVVYLLVDGVIHEFEFCLANNGSYLKLYYKDSINLDDGISNNGILIIAEAEEKKGRLYLTFTQDKLFDLEGKTVVLDPVLSED